MQVLSLSSISMILLLQCHCLSLQSFRKMLSFHDFYADKYSVVFGLHSETYILIRARALSGVETLLSCMNHHLSKLITFLSG